MAVLQTNRREEARQKVLDALDGWAWSHLGKHSDGPNDQDLPELFRTVDAVLDRMVARKGHSFEDAA